MPSHGSRAWQHRTTRPRAGARRDGKKRKARGTRDAPDLTIERTLFDDGHDTVAGLDEVGRGAWAGPLVVGVVVIDVHAGPVPDGTADSKLLTASAREALQPRLVEWCTAWALGSVSAREIDAMGLTMALTLAAHRALAALPATPSAVIVDGPVDFVRPAGQLELGSGPVPGPDLKVVRAEIGADRTCGTVAAASVLAKVARDARMCALADRQPGYGFEQHKGYGTVEHAYAIGAHGLTSQHRRTWSFALDEELEGAPASRAADLAR